MREERKWTRKKNILVKKQKRKNKRKIIERSIIKNNVNSLTIARRAV